MMRSDLVVLPEPNIDDAAIAPLDADEGVGSGHANTICCGC